MKKLLHEHVYVLGTAEIAPEKFQFESVTPSVAKTPAQTMKGKLEIHENGNVDFTPKGELPVQLETTPVAHGEDWKLRKNGKNYLLQVKIPLMEPDAWTLARLREMTKDVMWMISEHRFYLKDKNKIA